MAVEGEAGSAARRAVVVLSAGRLGEALAASDRVAGVAEVAGRAVEGAIPAATSHGATKNQEAARAARNRGKGLAKG